MIISIRGTSGSGKSTIVRNLMRCYNFKVARFIEGRKQPIGYHCYNPEAGHKPLAVIGHYEFACGGCDTIHSFVEVFECVRNAKDLGMNVIFEGVLLYSEIPLTLKLAQDFPTTIIALNTPIDVCVASVMERRQNRNVLETPKPLDPKNTISKFNGTISAMETLTANGLGVEWLNRDQALARCCELFGVTPGMHLLQ